VSKSLEEINRRIQRGEAVVVTAEEVIPLVRQRGPRRVAQEVDVVTAATFAPMCSSGAFFNFGHTDPPMKMQRVRLNDVPAYGGLAAVDAYLGATEPSLSQADAYGGAHVIEDLIRGNSVKLEAEGRATDCYPRGLLRTRIRLDDLNQAYLFNPRNCYQNYAAATNLSARTLYTYMGKLLPHGANVTYCSAGALSPLLNDPDLRAVGIGTRIFLGGGIGYVVWEGTQHCPGRARRGKVPVGPGATLALIGDLRGMNPRFLRAARLPRYGTTLFVGVGVAIPVLDEEVARQVGISDEEIYTVVVDYGHPGRQRPVVAEVSYAQLRSGSVHIQGREAITAPLSSLQKAREIASTLKEWIRTGRFLLTQPVAALPWRDRLRTLTATMPDEICISEDAEPEVAASVSATPASPEVDWDRCMACGFCTAVCLPRALSLDRDTWRLIWQPSRCTSCGLCLDTCPVGALHAPETGPQGDVELAR